MLSPENHHDSSLRFDASAAGFDSARLLGPQSLQETSHPTARSPKSPYIRPCQMGRIEGLGILLHVLGRMLLCYHGAIGDSMRAGVVAARRKPPRCYTMTSVPVGGVGPAVAIAPSASYSITLRVEIKNRPGMLGRVASAIGNAGGDIG